MPFCMTPSAALSPRPRRLLPLLRWTALVAFSVVLLHNVVPARASCSVHTTCNGCLYEEHRVAGIKNKLRKHLATPKNEPCCYDLAHSTCSPAPKGTSCIKYFVREYNEAARVPNCPAIELMKPSKMLKSYLSKTPGVDTEAMCAQIEEVEPQERDPSLLQDAASELCRLLQGRVSLLPMTKDVSLSAETPHTTCTFSFLTLKQRFRAEAQASLSHAEDRYYLALNDMEWLNPATQALRQEPDEGSSRKFVYTLDSMDVLHITYTLSEGFLEVEAVLDLVALLWNGVVAGICLPK